MKRYSSGMRMRLAFATAAHIEPPIIVVDEVLAVGDAAFREKCLGKMSEIGRHGRTVLYVSHDLGSITRLCPRAIWLEKGQVRADGPAADVVASYLHRGDVAAPLFAEFPEDDDLPCALTSVAIRDPDGQVITRPKRDQPFVVDLGIRVREPIPELDVAIRLVNETGVRVIDDGWSDTKPDVGLGEEPGDYHVAASVPLCSRPGGTPSEYGSATLTRRCWIAKCSLWTWRRASMTVRRWSSGHGSCNPRSPGRFRALGSNGRDHGVPEFLTALMAITTW